jgi:hypothetical protein
MGSLDPFQHVKHKLWPKEGPGVKLAIWLPTTKSRELTRFPCVQVACNIPLESCQRGLQLCFRLISIGGLHTKVRGPKVAGVSTLVISGFPFGKPKTKSHLDVSFMERHIIYYKGEDDGFPQVWAVVSLVNLSYLWLVLTPKVLQLCTNRLVLVLCRPVWVVDACHLS